MAQLGFGEQAIVFATMAGPDGMTWLNLAQARASGIDVNILSADGSQTGAGESLGLSLPPGFFWVVLESASTVAGLKFATSADVMVKTRNGYFASALGPFSREAAAGVLEAEGMPDDAYLSSGKGFVFSLN